MRVNNYDKCINDVINAIEKNLEFVTIEELIALSGYSYYHFHRIFKIHTGESLKKYIKRLQLERALQKMKIDKENITQLALEAGFYMSSSFNKAFKEMFELSPTEYKKQLAQKRERFLEITPVRFESLKPFEVFALRYVGECELIDTSFEKMLGFANGNNLFEESFELYGITYDDPDVTEDTKLRYDICIKKTTEIDISESSEIYLKTIDGGKYAVFHHNTGTPTLVDTYNSIFGKWLYQNDIRLRNVPIVQKIYYDPTLESIDDYLIDIYIPIE